MAKKPNISSVATGYQGTVTINNNFENVRDKFDNTLSLDGSTPNAMQADLDMNGNDIINVGSANGNAILTVTTADARYVNTTGDTMTGSLTAPAVYTNGLFLNGNPVSPTSLVYNGIVKETKIATSGQTVFNLTSISYTPGINNLAVYVDGLYQKPANYTETNSTRVTFSVGLHVGAIVDFVVLSIGSLSGTADATNLTYTATGSGAQSRTVKSKLDDFINVKDFGAIGDGVTNDAPAIQAAIDAASTSSGIVFIPAGTYYINSANGIDLRGKYVTIEGAGFNNSSSLTRTTLLAGPLTTSVFNVSETSDTVVSPFFVRNLAIFGNSTATNGFNIRYRHFFVIENVWITGCTYGIQEKDTWLGIHKNLRIDTSTYGLWLVGSNHNSYYERIAISNCTSYHLRVNSNGTALDGNMALVFNCCDFEFGPVSGGGAVYFDGTSATFSGCYSGENIYGEIFTIVNGNVNINGGIIFYGKSANSFAFDMLGGSALVENIAIAAQGLDIGGLAKGNGSGRVAFKNVRAGVAVGGNQVLDGDPLDYNAKTQVFCTRYGKNFTNTPFNNTVTTSVTNNSKTFTVATVTGSPSILYASAALITPSEILMNKKLYLVVVYSSNVEVRAALAASPFGGAPTTLIGAMPNTSGAIKTYVKMDVPFDNTGYTLLEFYNDTATATSSFTIHEVFLADYSFLQEKTGSSFSNLYKC